MDVHDQLLLCHENYVEFHRTTQRRSDGTVLEEAGVCMWAGNNPFPIFTNSAARTDPNAAPDDVIARARAFFAERERSWSLSTLSPLDDDLEAVAKAGGLNQLTNAPQMVIDLPLSEVEPPSDVTLRLVEDAVAMHDFAVVNGEAFSVYGMPIDAMEANFCNPERWLRPDTAAFVAYIGDEVAAAAMVNMSHGMGCVNNVATHSAHRGRGLGELVTRAATNAGFDLGARFVGLQASPMGEPVYTRMGYVEIGRFRSLLAS
jgi:GNAT superfamily N-acetyltransferase